MKIALISPPLLKTPPTSYGGLEQVVYDLGVALTELGADVTLIAPRGSTIGEKGKVIETTIAKEKTDVNWVQEENVAYNIYAPRLNEFDIVHDHTWFGFAYLSKNDGCKFKICHTHHGHLDWNPANIPPSIKNINLIGISEFMAKTYRAMGHGARFVYNGIDTAKYKPFGGEKENRFVFVGRISKLKLPHIAIDLAIDTKIPIDIVGGSFVAPDEVQYIEYIKRRCSQSGGLATLHLDLPHDKKIEIIGKAKAMIMPSNFNEPFGLTSVEAMACGTPVISTNDGALGELIISGETGFVCNDYREMRDAASKVADISVDACIARARVFSRENMAKNYLSLYSEMSDGAVW